MLTVYLFFAYISRKFICSYTFVKAKVGTEFVTRKMVCFCKSDFVNNCKFKL